MSQKRPWHTALSSLVITLSDDSAAAVAAITAHESITAERVVDRYLPVAIEAADARIIHDWLNALPGVTYIDVVFCATEPPHETPSETPRLYATATEEPIYLKS
mgnify:CR=1 FL=1